MTKEGKINLKVIKIDSNKYLVAFVLLFVGQVASAQPQLSLKDLLNQADNYYPALKAARLEQRASIDDLEATRRLYWPNVSAVVESTSAKPYTANAIPSRQIQIEQTLWDAGQVSSKVSESKSQADIQAIKATLIKEEVFLQIANAWQNLLASKGRMSAAQDALARLMGFQIQMQRRVEAEVSPRIDLEFANSRVLQTQVEFKLAENSLNQALTRIEQYTGQIELKSLLANTDAVRAIVPPPAFESELNRSNLQKWAEQHPSIAKAKAETVQSQSRLDQKKSETWPQLYARISKPISSTVPGYTPEPTAFVGIRYSTSSGFSNHLQAQALATRVASAEEQVTAAINDLLHSLKTDQDEYFNAKYRIQSLEQAVRGSDLVLASYQRQFQAGKKSWQDLLNAVRESAQNEYALADARASMLGALYRVQIRAGLEVQ